MVDGRCATCKHWNAYEDKRMSGWGFCLVPSLPYRNKLMRVEGEDKHGKTCPECIISFDTKPTFGCVHWEAEE